MGCKNLHIVHDGVALVHLAHLVAAPAVEEQPLAHLRFRQPTKPARQRSRGSGRSFASINMRCDSNVARELCARQRRRFCCAAE